MLTVYKHFMNKTIKVETYLKKVILYKMFKL